MEPGWALIRSSRRAGRAPPSSSYGIFRSNRTLIFVPCVISTNGDRSAWPSASLLKVRAHSAGFFAVTTPNSRSPSSGRACGKASIPPSTRPTLPASTQETWPLKKRSPSTSIVALTRRADRFLIPVYRYAVRPRRSFMPRPASEIIRASNPAPAITVKCSPFSDPVSSRRRSPCSPIRTASGRSSGICRFMARRFAVPAGRIATAVPVPATASIQRWTVPSPPQTNITSAP